MGMDNQPVTIKIFGAPLAGCSCGASCGSSCGPNSCAPTETMEEAVRAVAAALTEEYGQRVVVEYVDIMSGDIKDYPEVLQLVRGGYGFPLTFINDIPKFAGGLSLPMIKKVIDELL